MEIMEILVVNKGALEVYECNSAEAARIMGCDESELRWCVKRTGRYDFGSCVAIEKNNPYEVKD